jgi:predicted transcriptional regulator
LLRYRIGVWRKGKKLPRIGELELAVLEHLWSVPDADVLEVHAAVGSRRGITSNTVGSALERLHRKALALREKVSHAYRYRPALSRDDFAAQRMLDAAGGLETLTETGLLSAFIDLVAEDEESLDRLETLIEEKRSLRGDE